ncbi:MAG: hypothetical protein H0W67_09370 [Gemmatimonadales bacterium]|nr:hypothetical protein [Gemmatimonadales bacterium]
MNEPVIVELVGLPGAGKTTLATRVLDTSADSTGRTGGRALLRTARAARSAPFGFFLRHPAAAAASGGLLAAALLSGPDAVIHAGRLAMWGGHLETLATTDCELLVLDQGAVQQAWSAAHRLGPGGMRRVEPVLRSLLRSSPVQPILVFCDLPPELAWRRVQAREDGRSMLDGMSHERALPLLKTAAPALQGLTERISRDLGLPYLLLDTSEHLDIAAARLRDFLSDATLNPRSSAASLPVG